MWSHWCQIKEIVLYINAHCAYNLPVCMKLTPHFCQILYRGFWPKFVISSVLFKTTEISHFYMKTDIHLYYLSCCLNWTNIYVVEVCTCIFSYIFPHFVKWGQPTKHKFHRRSKKQILMTLPSLLQILFMLSLWSAHAQYMGAVGVLFNMGLQIMYSTSSSKNMQHFFWVEEGGGEYFCTMATTWWLLEI